MQVLLLCWHWSLSSRQSKPLRSGLCSGVGSLICSGVIGVFCFSFSKLLISAFGTAKSFPFYFLLAIITVNHSYLIASATLRLPNIGHFNSFLQRSVCTINKLGRTIMNLALLDYLLNCGYFFRLFRLNILVILFNILDRL